MLTPRDLARKGLGLVMGVQFAKKLNQFLLVRSDLHETLQRASADEYLQAYCKFPSISVVKVDFHVL